MDLSLRLGELCLTTSDLAEQNIFFALTLAYSETKGLPVQQRQIARRVAERIMSERPLVEDRELLQVAILLGGEEAETALTALQWYIERRQHEDPGTTLVPPLQRPAINLYLASRAWLDLHSPDRGVDAS